MEITESILTSVKKLLGIDEGYTHFDADIVMQDRLCGLLQMPP